MLRGLEVVKTNDVAQAVNQTIQLQLLSPLLGVQPCQHLFTERFDKRSPTLLLASTKRGGPQGRP
jgi:hypothetical protein